MTITDLIGADQQPWANDGDCTKFRPISAAEHRDYADRWFVETPDNAKVLCGQCPVRDACLAWALDYRTDTGGRIEGIWGATTTEQRAKLRGGVAA